MISRFSRTFLLIIVALARPLLTVFYMTADFLS
jgi:FAD-linked sulfhydryl oxidase